MSKQYMFRYLLLYFVFAACWGETAANSLQEQMNQNVKKGYRIQVFALSTKVDAYEAKEAASKALKDTNASLYFEYVDGLFKLHVGDCVSRSEADSLLKIIKEMGYSDAWVVSSDVQTSPSPSQTPQPTKPIEQTPNTPPSDIATFLSALGDAVENATPLHNAAARGDLDLAKRLLNEGNDVNARTKGGSTPLHWAALRGNIAIIKLLIANGATVDAKTLDGLTPLGKAVYGDYRKSKVIIPFLVSSGANVNVRFNDGSTLLHKMVSIRRLEMLKTLLTNGADPNLKDSLGIGPLSTAAFLGYMDELQLLIDNGADVNSKDVTLGYTPLHIASMAGKYSIVKILLKHNAEVNAKTLTGSTPLSVAEAEGHEDIASLLRKHGAHN